MFQIRKLFDSIRILARHFSLDIVVWINKEAFYEIIMNWYWYKLFKSSFRVFFTVIWQTRQLWLVIQWTRLQNGYTKCYVSERFRVSRSTVQRIWTKFQETDSLKRKIGLARKRCTDLCKMVLGTIFI